jgi:hypothetical protein
MCAAQTCAANAFVNEFQSTIKILFLRKFAYSALPGKHSAPGASKGGHPQPDQAGTLFISRRSKLGLR